MPRESKSVAQREQAVESLSPPGGIILDGVVQGRSKREFTNETTGEVRVRTNYSVVAGGVVVQLEAWNHAQPFRIGEKIAEKIVIRTFSGRGGQARYSLALASNETDGTPF